MHFTRLELAFSLLAEEKDTGLSTDIESLTASANQLA